MKFKKVNDRVRALIDEDQVKKGMVGTVLEDGGDNDSIPVDFDTLTDSAIQFISLGSTVTNSRISNCTIQASTAGTANGSSLVIANPTGQALTSNLGSVSITANADVGITGQELTATEGTLTLDANTLVDLTGQAMTMQEGTATADDASAEITGLSLSMSLGTVKNIMWSEVNTGITQPWTEVDTAA